MKRKMHLFALSVASELKKKKIIYLFFSVLGLRCRSGFSLVVESGGYSVVVACGPLIVVASLVEKHGLWGPQVSALVAPRLQSTGSIVVVHEPSCSSMWDLPGPGIEPMSPALAGGFFTMEALDITSFTYLSVPFSPSSGTPRTTWRFYCHCA